jgi:ATP-dependent protease ClpP protease subunit
LIYIGEKMIKYLFLLLVSTSVFGNPTKILLTENNHVVFNQQVTGEYTSKKTLEIMEKSLKASPIYLVLDTPGGSVSAGLAFVDSIKALDIKVHTITIFAASMGYQFVQELGTRYILPSGTLMSHRGAVGGLSGQVPGELNSRLGRIQKILDGMSDRAAARVKMSKKDYDAAIINELWVSGQDAVSGNHADAIASVKCDKQLIQEKYTETLVTIFGSVGLVFSKCPLISSPIDVKFSKEVKPEHFEVLKRTINANKYKFNLTL